MQLAEMGSLLRSRGWQVEEGSAARDISPAGGDLVVLANIQRCHDWGTLPERAARAGAALVVVPLYHPLHRYHREGRRGLDGLLSKVLRRPQSFAALRWGRVDLAGRAAAVLGMADRVLLAHEGEARLLHDDLGYSCAQGRTRVVPVAVPARDLADESPAALFDGRDFVLCAGRIEPLKNSLAVALAAQQLDLPVAFAGALPGARHVLYGARMKASLRARGPNSARLLGEVPYPQLRQLMGQARVHVLASWTEVVGRVSLEAALAGAAVVASDTGHLPEYLGRDSEGLFLFDPGDPDALRSALAAAWQHGRKQDGALAERVRARFTWDVVGPQLLEALPQ
jgi:glycosyltransferase involved in cell wall biosynthesis